MIPGKSCPSGDPRDVSMPFVHVCLHSPTDILRSVGEDEIEGELRESWNGIRWGEGEGEGKIVNVISRFVPLVNGLEAVVTSGDLLARGAGREIGNSIESLSSAPSTMTRQLRNHCFTHLISLFNTPFLLNSTLNFQVTLSPPKLPSVYREGMIPDSSSPVSRL